MIFPDTFDPAYAELHETGRHEISTRDVSQCGECLRTWCHRCSPTPAARCPFEYDHGTIERADCGHNYTRPTPGVGGPSGYAVHPETGRTMCYPDAETYERETMARRNVHTAYVREQDGTVTTWTGGNLGKIIRVSRSTPRTSSQGLRWRMRYVEVTAFDGSFWRGHGSDQYDSVTLRRVTPLGG